MKTVKALFTIAALALCFSTAARAEQNAHAAVLAPAGCEEVIITAQRVTATAPKMGAVDRSALSASIKSESRKAIEQFIAHPAKTASQNSRSEVLQASL